METSALTAIHERAGARLLPAGPHALLTYGDVPAEYRAGLQGCALFDQTERGQLEVGGGEAPAFLHRILSNDVRGLAPGTGDRNLLLSPKGKVLHDFDLLPGPSGGYLLSTEPGGAGGLAARLDTYLFAEDVTLTDRTALHAPLEVVGPRAGEVLTHVLGTPPPEQTYRPEDATWEGGPLRIVALPVAGSPGWRLDAGPGGVADLWRALRDAGGRPAGRVARDSLRVEAGRAEWGLDIDENVYPQEARLEDAFSLDKGCYIGQEVVAKIDTYGGLNKCLFGLRVGHGDPVPCGTRLLREVAGDIRDVGLVTSWAYSFALDTGLCLAYVKRRHQALGTVFRLGDDAAEAELVALPARARALPLSGPAPGQA